MVALLQGLEGRSYLKQRSSLLFACVSKEPGCPATWSFWLGKLNCWPCECCPCPKWLSWGPFQARLQRNKCQQHQLEKHSVNSCANPALPGSQCVTRTLTFQLAPANCREGMGSKGVVTEMELPSSAVNRIISFPYCCHVACAGMVIVSLPNSRDQ